MSKDEERIFNNDNAEDPYDYSEVTMDNDTLNKHNACLCVHGGMQTWGQNYWETYTPVVKWASVCPILAIGKIHGLSSKSINLFLHFCKQTSRFLLFTWSCLLV